MQTNSRKTTVEIDVTLLQEAKMKAIRERKSLKEILNESLAKELGVKRIKARKEKIIIGGYKLGGVQGDLRRVALYEDR